MFYSFSIKANPRPDELKSIEFVSYKAGYFSVILWFYDGSKLTEAVKKEDIEQFCSKYDIPYSEVQAELEAMAGDKNDEGGTPPPPSGKKLK